MSMTTDELLAQEEADDYLNQQLEDCDTYEQDEYSQYKDECINSLKY